jgi:hypothetical protein
MCTPSDRSAGCPRLASTGRCWRMDRWQRTRAGRLAAAGRPVAVVPRVAAARAEPVVARAELAAGAPVVRAARVVARAEPAAVARVLLAGLARVGPVALEVVHTGLAAGQAGIRAVGLTGRTGIRDPVLASVPIGVAATAPMATAAVPVPMATVRPGPAVTAAPAAMADLARTATAVPHGRTEIAAGLVTAVRAPSVIEVRRAPTVMAGVLDPLATVRPGPAATVARVHMVTAHLAAAGPVPMATGVPRARMAMGAALALMTTVRLAVAAMADPALMAIARRRAHTAMVARGRMVTAHRATPATAAVLVLTVTGAGRGHMGIALLVRVARVARGRMVTAHRATPATAAVLVPMVTGAGRGRMGIARPGPVVTAVRAPTAIAGLRARMARVARGHMATEHVARVARVARGRMVTAHRVTAATAAVLVPMVTGAGRGRMGIARPGPVVTAVRAPTAIAGLRARMATVARGHMATAHRATAATAAVPGPMVTGVGRGLTVIARLAQTATVVPGPTVATAVRARTATAARGRTAAVIPARIVLSATTGAPAPTGHREAPQERTVVPLVHCVTPATAVPGVTPGDPAAREAGGAATIAASRLATVASVTAAGLRAEVPIADQAATAGTGAVRRGAMARSPAVKRSSLA